MARSPRHITILHAGSGHLSFVRADDSGKVSAQAHERGDWSVEGGTLAKALVDFSQKHALAEDAVYFVLPRHEAAVRILELPSHDPEELRGMVHLGAEEIVPFPLDELQTGYTLLEKLDGGVSRVLAVVVRKAIVESYVEAIRGAGLHLEQVYLSTACMLAALKQAGIRDTAAVHVGAEGLEVAVLRSGQITFGRGVAVPIAVESGRIAEASLEEIGAEVRSSLSASRRESPDGSAPSELLVSAAGVDGANLAQSLGETLGLSARAYQQNGLSSLVAAGAFATARGERSFAIELLPESEVQRRAATVSRARGLRVAVALLIAVVATAGVYGQMWMQRTAYLRELDAKADALRPLAQTLRTKRQQLKLIEDQVHRTASPIQILATIAKAAPTDGLDFTRFSYDVRQGVTVNGSAIEPKKFEDLIDGMRKTGIDTMPQFARAQELYRTERNDYGKKVWDFAISIPFTGEAESK